MKKIAAVMGTAFAIGVLFIPATMDVLAADITEARAREIAMEHAGVSEKKIPFIKAELDDEDGKTIYEVKFHTRDREEYEYEIDVSSGRIIKAEYDANVGSNGRDGQKDSYIKPERAKKIAAEQA
ncbi:MAG: PepSY domain-containing protein [Clostridiales bacterium]|nr:PepSY domain-containing protein [Clostridiales bacterium]